LQSLGRVSRYFIAAFGRDPTPADVVAPLASYVRTIVSGDSTYDRFIAGGARALDGSARRGFDLFGLRGERGVGQAPR
jgi:cytochrome c peroxidase